MSAQVTTPPPRPPMQAACPVCGRILPLTAFDAHVKKAHGV